MSVPVNLKYPSELAALGARVAKVVAWISGIFSLMLCITLILNYFQIVSADPLNDPALKALKAAIQKDPNNAELRERARTLHLMTRRAFFTNQEQMRAAGLLLLGGVALFLASMKTFMELTRRNPVPVGQAPREGGAQERAAGRWAVAAGAGVLVLASLILVYLSPPPLDFTVDPPAQPAKAEAPAEAPPAAAKTEAPSPAPASSSAKAPEDKPAAADPGKLEPVPAHAWPAFRGPHGQGVAGHKNAPLKWDGKSGDNVRWKVEIPRPGTGSVVTWEKRVFVSGSDEKEREIYCYDADSGKLLWTGPAGAIAGSPAELPKVMEGTTYSPATLAVDGRQVYAIYATGDVVAFGFDGRKAWARNLGVPKNSYGHSSSLVTHAGRVIVQFDDQNGGRLIALDAQTGKTAWEEKRDVKEAWSTPILANTGSRLEIIVSGNPLVSGHDPATGKTLWSVKVMGGEVTPSPAFAGGVAFFASDHAALAAIQMGGEGKILWKFEEDLPDVASPLATGKYVLISSSGGVVSCFEATTGKKLWSQEFDEGFYASPVLVDDRVYLMDRAGVTVVFKLGDKYEELSRNPLGEKADCTPAIPEGRIYLRSVKHLYCIGKSDS